MRPRSRTRSGWTLKPEGLCKDDTCVIVSDRAALFDGDRLDVTAVASLLDRPAAIDAGSGLVAIGAPREQRRAAVNDMKAPDFVLPDINGLPMHLLRPPEQEAIAGGVLLVVRLPPRSARLAGTPRRTR